MSQDFKKEVGKKMQLLRQTFAAGKTRPLEWRLGQLKALKRMLEEHNDDINAALWADLHKPSFESAISEQGIVIGEIEDTLDNLEEWMQPQSVPTRLLNLPGSCEIRSEPLGVALIIGAWNYPINLLLAPLVGAIAAGNAAIIKPSELSVNVAALVGRLVPQYLDASAYIVVEAGVEGTQILLEEKFDHIFFTGSTHVGKIVMGKAAETVTPVTLELGGKSPAVVTAAADIKVAARRIAWGKFMNAGQTCVAPDYVLIAESVQEDFLQEIKNTIHAFYGNNPKTSPDFCRIVNDRNFTRLTHFLNNGTMVCGGDTDAGERYIGPTVLKDVSPTAAIMQEEIFGPILPVLAVPDLSAAIQFINERPKPLALYLFSSEKDQQERILNETSSGGVCINDVIMHMSSPDLPFGGVGASGMGAYHGRRSFEVFSHQKSVLKKTTWPDVPIRYAPYKESDLKWVKRLS